ncbi:MAG: cell envelope integrity protein TolA [Campylobacterales bacterium]|nr:cell envelope integrity protein TolA [Campylobacterales bacterium]
MFNRGKLYSGVAAIGIYLLLIFIVLYYYNVHAQKAKNYVEKNSNRVTVTLVNSDKTVFNRSDEVNKPKKPVEGKKAPVAPPTPQKESEAKKEPEIKKEPEPKKEVKTPTLAEDQKRKEQQRQEAVRQERERQAQIAKEAEQKKALEAKKIAEAKRQAQLEAEKKKQQEEAKRREAERQKEAERKRLAEEAQKRREEAERKKNQQQPKDLFANVNTNEPVKQTTQPTSEPSQIKHTSSAIDRIRNTQLSGQQSDQNRERGIEDAYLAKVKNQLNNWSAQSNYKGHTATIRLTITSSGHFSYTIQSSTSGEMSAGLRDFLDQLNRIGLGSHSKSSPYVISVNFIAR